MNSQYRAFGTGCIFALVVMLTASMALAQAWTGRHGDTGRTGRSAGTGDITRPAAAWKISIGSEVPGARVLVEDINDDGELEYLTMVDGAVLARNFNDVILWDSPPLGVSSFSEVADLDGDGRPEIILIGRLAVVLDGETGQVLWRRVPDTPTSLSFRAGTVRAVNVDDDPEKELFFAAGDKIAELYDFSQGFDVEPSWVNTDTAMPTAVVRPIIGDFDADPSTNEVALVNQSFCQILFISLDTGETLRVSASLTNGLFCYGLYQAANVDSDPQDEVIFTGTIGASRGSVSLTVYDFVEDETQWQYEYANNSTALSTLTPAGAVADLDDDGQLEIFTAVYNNGAESGPQDDGIALADQWSVAVYDAASGETLGSLENRTIIGHADLDHDGVAELITRSATPGSIALPGTGTIEVWTLDTNRAPQLRWEVPDVSAVLQTPPINTTTSSRDFNAIPGIFDLSGNGEAKLLVAADAGDSVTVQALSFGDEVSVSAQVELAGGTDVSLIQTSEGLLETPHVVLRSTLGRFTVHDDTLEAVDSLKLSGHVSTVLAVKLVEGTALQTIHLDATNALVALDPTNANPLQAPQQLWSRPTNGGDFVSFDRDGDGLYEVVYASTDDNGTPFIEMLDNRGEVLWSQTLEEARFAPFALTFGQFGGTGDTIDVAGLTFLQDSSPITWTLDGSSGEIISAYSASPADVNPNPNRDLMAIGDRNDDGNDDLLLMHFTTMEQLSGIDLSRIGDVVAFPPNNANPINNSVVATPDRVDAYVKPFRSQLFSMDVIAGQTSWTSDLPASLNSYVSNFAGYSDVNSDGRMDIAVPGFLGDLTLFDGATGEVLWRVCLDDGEAFPLEEPATLESCQPIAPVSAVATADIDGDGGEEFIVGDSPGFLYALDVETGAVSWSEDLTARVSAPAVADLDGDGNLEIMVTTSRSELLVVDHASITPTSEVRDVALSEEEEIDDADTDIDQTSTQSSLGVAWEATPRTDGYLVSLRTSNNTEVVGSTNVGDVTQHIFTGLNLIPGTTYIASVVAFSDTLGASPGTDSDGVLVVGDPPQITDLSAAPNPLTLDLGESTEITAVVSADGVIPLASVTLEIVSSDETVVASQENQPGLSSFNLSFRWDGTDSDNQPVTSGEYELRLSATDELGASTQATASLTVREPGDPIITRFEASPQDFTPGAGQTTTLSGAVSADSGVDLDSVEVRITNADNILVFEEVFSPGANSFGLRTSWDGTDTLNNLVPAGLYSARLSAADSLGNTSSASVNVNVLGPDAPTIDGFAATPDAIDPELEQTTDITAQVSATGAIDEVTLTIALDENPEVLRQTFAPQSNSFSLSTPWDGKLDGEKVPAGLYTATLEVRDVFGGATQDEISIEVIQPQTVISDFIADPDGFNIGFGEVTTLSATISSTETGTVETVTLDISGEDDVQVFSRAFTPSATSFAFQAVWDGHDLSSGQPVEPGVYTATLSAVDNVGAETSESLTLTVLFTDPGGDTGTPDTGTPDMMMPDAGAPDGGSSEPVVIYTPGNNCACATPAAPTRHRPLGWFVVVFGVAVALRRRL